VARARILVVDDEAGMLRSMERILAPQHEVVAHRVPQEAVAAARGEDFDVAILDVRMPGMDGFDVMAALKTLQPELDVILMTGSVHEADARLIRAIRERAFFFLTKPFDRDVLLALVSRCLELRRANAENRLHVERLELELHAAQRFQTSLMPANHVRHGRVAIEARYLPWTQLGGDFYDCAPAGADGAVLLIVDVSGHGASAAMLTGMVKLAFRDALVQGDEPVDIVRRIAQSRPLFPEGQHLTTLCARIDPEAGRLDYVNAGHPPGLLVRASGELVRLETTAPLVHPVFERWECESRSVSFGPGDEALLYTDGVTECRRAGESDDDPEAEQFGLERLEAALAERGRDPIETILARLSTFQAGRPLEDDVAMILGRVEV
jgi:phosphoserine phosphatase RsbU/P